MPRPVRTRKASRVPSQRESSATPAPITKKPAPAPAPNPDSDIYSVSEEEKERQRKRAEARRTQQSNDTHDVSEKEKERGEARQTLLELNPERVNALEDSRRKRDAAMDKLADISSTTKDADSGSADVLDSPAIELSRREDVSIAGPARRVTDVSGLDLDDSTFKNLDDSLEDSQHVIEDTRSGYRSTDTSSFNINLFKRRPRQSSIVGKDDAPIRPSSRGQNTPSISSHLNLGLFKRRAREPSILGTAQKDRSTRPASRATSVASRTSRTSRNGDVTADEDSGPDDESTPLNLAKRRSSAATGADMTIEMSPTLPSRKRKSLDDPENGREKRPALERGAAEAAEEEEEEVIHQSIEMDNTPMIPSTPLNRSISDHLSSPPQQIFDPNDPDMAPPASSSSSEGGSPVVWPSLDALAHRNYHHNSKRSAPVHKTPELEADDHSSVVSSPPSLTHSPNYNSRPRTAKAAAPPKKKAAPKPPVTTTADLTSLLPQRRSKKMASRKNKDPFEMEDSDVEAEQGSETEDGEGDELSVYVDPRTAARRRRVAQAGSANKSANAKSGSATKGRGSSSKKSKGKGKDVEVTPVRGRNRNKNKQVRTYGSQENEEGEIVVATDDDDGQEGEENEEAEQDQRSGSPEETSQMMLDRLGEELQAAKKKFKEVDKWELSFEEVDRSSSPVDGR
ncbi:hypothetical protein V8F33_011047 [Rhypophila sp. PSN 637]